MRPTLSGASFFAALLVLGGCGLFTKPEEQPLQEAKTKELPDRPSITVGELDQRARNFSDRLVARVSTACDRIKRDAPDDDARARAHQLKLSVALAAYDIVSSPGGGHEVPAAAAHVLDLTVLTELHAIRWIDEHEARDEFGARGEDLAEALSKAREDVWAIVGRFMSPPQVDELKTMILHWRRQNPKVEWLSRVRLDAVAQGQEGAAFTKSVSQSFNPIQSALRAVDETRLLAQQALFWVKRVPTLLDWTAEATVTDALEVPKVNLLVQGLTSTLGSVSRAVATLERLTEPSSQEPVVNSTIEEVKESLIQAKELVQEVRALQAAVQPLLDRAKKPPASSSAAPARPLDLEHVASKVDDAAREATSLVRETRALAESPTAVQNVDEVLGRTTRNLSVTGRDVIDHAAWRAVELVFLIAVLVIGFKIAQWLFRKRRARPANP